MKGFLAIAAVFFIAQAAEAGETRSLAGVVISVPDGAFVDAGSDDGVKSASINLMGRGRIYVASYGWANSLGLHGPKSAEEYIAMQPRDSEIEPLAEFQYKGLRAWSRVRKTAIGMPSRGIPMTDWIEKDVYVQRRHGFFVATFVSPPSAFKDDVGGFDAFMANIRLKPEPPIGPKPALALLILLLGAGGTALYRKYRSK